jgi:hypothetical protein
MLSLRYITTQQHLPGNRWFTNNYFFTHWLYLRFRRCVVSLLNYIGRMRIQGAFSKHMDVSVCFFIALRIRRIFLLPCMPCIHELLQHHYSNNNNNVAVPQSYTTHAAYVLDVNDYARNCIVIYDDSSAFDPRKNH